MMKSFLRLFVAGLLILAIAGTSSAAGAQAVEEEPPRLLAVGDIADCKRMEQVQQVAAELAGSDSLIAALGDLVYPDGTADDFADCFDPIYGSMSDRFRPALGNHEYNTGSAAAYHDYFGAVAGDPGDGWYAYDLGTWQIIALNSNCSDVDGCDSDSRQYAWLEAELAARPGACRIAYWHHPRFTSSSRHADKRSMGPLVELLADAGTEAVLAGHSHQYERLGRLAADGTVDGSGIRFFTVGTGGATPYEFGEIHPGSEIRRSGSLGALELTLYETSFTWRFDSTNDEFVDAGTETCQNALLTQSVSGIHRLYQAAFNRAPDAAGFDYWVERRRQGLTLHRMAAFFEDSAEFQRRFGSPTDAGFVDLIYQNVLGRPADSAGRAFWIGFLADHPRWLMLAHVSQADEFSP